VNVVVIGGGVIGYSVAHALAARGARVTVIDTRVPGGGATQASAGMLAPYIEGHDERLLELGVASLALYPRFIESLTVRGADIEHRQSGTLQVAYSTGHADSLVRSAERLKARGVVHALLTPAEIHVREPGISSGTIAGLLVPEHGYVHVGELMTSLTSAATRDGVMAISGRVDRIESRPQGVRVVVGDVTLDASVAVIAAGSWSGELRLADSQPIPVRPIRGQSLELAFDVPPLAHVVWSEDCYLVPRRSGSVIVGATVEDVGFDESATADGLRFLRERATAVLPAAAAAPLTQIRVGLRPATADELPIIGWSSAMPRVCVATGHYRNGILLAPLTAQLVSDLVMESETPELVWAAKLVSPSRLGL
jgi:glycine oxidase